VEEKWSVKMKGRVCRACVRVAMVYGGETWVMTKEEDCVMQKAERATVRTMCGVKFRDRKSNNEMMSVIGLNEDIVTLVRKSRLRWYGHVMKRDEGVGIRSMLEYEVAGEIGRGRPRMGWKEQVEKDTVKAGLRRDDVQDRDAWRREIFVFS
jgi:hypothetical protein